MKELSDLEGWTVNVSVDLTDAVDLNGYILFCKQGNIKDYLIMLITEDESGELFYSPQSKRILEDRLYGLYDAKSKSLTSLGKLCVEYSVFTYNEIVTMEDKRNRLTKDIRLAYLKRKIEIYENMILEMPEVKKEYETLKNS